MPLDMFQRGSAMIERVRRDHLTHAVVYVVSTAPGGALPPSSINIDATRGSSDFDVVQDDGVSRVERTVDFIFGRGSIGGTTPKAGDEVRETIDGVTTVYELVEIEGLPTWSFDDALRDRIRVHTREIGAPTP